MLDGLEVSEIRYKDIIADDKGFRIDPEYYQQRYIELEKLLKSRNAQTLESISESIINFGAYSLTNQINYLDEGVPFLNVGDIKENIINLSTAKLIDETLSKELLHKSLVKDGQVLLTIAGTIGNAAVAYKLPPATNSNQAIANITLHKGISPFYISTFLNSDYGKSQTKRLIISNVQPNLLLTQVKQIQIILFSEDFQKQIEKTVKSAHAKLEQSKRLYAEAEETLLEELGLKNWRPPKESISVKSFGESFGKSGRLDAEFYQPKYDALLSAITKKGKSYKIVKDMAVFNARGTQPVYVADGELQVINSKHILETRLDYDNFERTNNLYWDEEKGSRVFENDILIYTTGANVGRANVYLEKDKALASNHVNILRLNGENQIYVGFVLNSMIGRMQTEKFTTGSAQAELYTTDIERFTIPFVEPKQQKKIADLVIKSHLAVKESKRLLEMSRRAVESAIEKGESMGMKVLEG